MQVFRLSGFQAGVFQVFRLACRFSGWRAGFQVFRCSGWHAGFQVFRFWGEGFQVLRLACRVFGFSGWHEGVQVFMFSGWHAGFQFFRFSGWNAGFQAFRWACRFSGFQVFRFAGRHAGFQVFRFPGLHLCCSRFSGWHVSFQVHPCSSQIKSNCAPNFRATCHKCTRIYIWQALGSNLAVRRTYHVFWFSVIRHINCQGCFSPSSHQRFADPQIITEIYRACIRLKHSAQHGVAGFCFFAKGPADI